MTVYTRQFNVTFQMRDFTDGGDGRTVFGRIVPFGEVINFVDEYDANRIKKERFVKGAFSKQSKPAAWARVLLTFHHEDGFTNTIGYGRNVRELDDGAYATFRLYEADASKAREMIENSHSGLSVAFSPRGRERTDETGVIVRDSVHVHKVGITNDPAYTGAEVLAVRESDGDLGTPHLDQVRADLALMRAHDPMGGAR